MPPAATTSQRGCDVFRPRLFKKLSTLHRFHAPALDVTGPPAVMESAPEGRFPIPSRLPGGQPAGPATLARVTSRASFGISSSQACRWRHRFNSSGLAQRGLDRSQSGSFVGHSVRPRAARKTAAATHTRRGPTSGRCSPGSRDDGTQPGSAARSPSSEPRAPGAVRAGSLRVMALLPLTCRCRQQGGDAVGGMPIALDGRMMPIQ